MTIITKASLAAELGITKARVSQYVKAGLPVRTDGKLDRERALNWIGRNVAADAVADKGSTRARRLAQPSQRRVVSAQLAPKPRPGGDAEYMAKAIAHRLGRITASMAVHVGAPLRVAYALHDAVTLATIAEFSEIGREAGIEPWASNADPPIWEPKDFEQIDWEALAAIAGETLDAAACEAYARERFGYLD
jgi:hypothetical protein